MFWNVSVRTISSVKVILRVDNQRTGRKWWIVVQIPGRADVAEVAACTTAAAHGRDHDHALSLQCCHPHAVQVVYLGHRALTVCHDCRADSGFLPYREAERLAEGHRDQTRTASVCLTLAEAS